MNPDTDAPGKELPTGQTVQSVLDPSASPYTSLEPGKDAAKFNFDPMPAEVRVQFEQNESTIRGIQCNNMASYASHDFQSGFNHIGSSVRMLRRIYDEELVALYREIMNEGSHLTKLNTDILDRHKLLQQGQLSETAELSNMSTLVAASARRCHSHRIRYNQLCIHRSMAQAQIDEQARAEEKANQTESHVDSEAPVQTASQTPADNLAGADLDGIPVSAFLTACDRGRGGDLGGQGDSDIPRGAQAASPVNTPSESDSGGGVENGHGTGTDGGPGSPAAAGDENPTGAESGIGSGPSGTIPDLKFRPCHGVGAPTAPPFHPSGLYGQPAGYPHGFGHYATPAHLQGRYDVPTGNAVGGGFVDFGPGPMGAGIYGQAYGDLPPPLPSFVRSPHWLPGSQMLPIAPYQVATTFAGNAVMSDGTIKCGSSTESMIREFFPGGAAFQTSPENAVSSDDTMDPLREIINDSYYYQGVLGWGPSSLSVGPPSNNTGEGLDTTENRESPADDPIVLRTPGTDHTPGEAVTQPVHRNTAYRDNYRGRGRGRHFRNNRGNRRGGVRTTL